MTIRIHGLAVLLPALLVAGCGSDRGSGGPVGPIPIDRVPAEFASASCSKLESCLGDFEEIFGALFGDCRTTLEGQFAERGVARWQTAMAMGTFVYHDDLFASCLSRIRSLSCSAIQAGRAPAECEDALEGLVALGGACNIDDECMGTAYCNFTGSCPGACTPLAGEGMTCDEDDHCSAGLRCQSGTCGAPAAHGGACEGPSPTARDCALGDVCIGASETSSGSCRSPSEVFTVASGGTCNFETGLLCAGGLSCTAMVSGMMPTLTCRAGVPSGAPCSFGVPDPCPDGEYCNADIEMMRYTGVCVRLPSEGQACADTLFADCQPGLSCSSGMCRRTQHIGGACMSDSHCYSGNCVSMTCAAADFCEGP